MRWHAPLVMMLLFTPVISLFAEETNEAEPIQKFVLTIDNAAHEVVLNTDLDMVIAGKKHRIRLEMNPVRKFEKAGIGFDFETKRHFSYEALSPEVDHWAVEGNNSLIMVQSYKVKTEKSAILESFIDQYKKMKAEIERFEINLKYQGKDLAGERLLINMGDITLEQQIFFFSQDNTSRVIILQDTINDDKNNSEEFVKMRKLLEESLTITL